MKKLFWTFFKVSDDEKIRDKVMMTRTVTTVITVLLCLAAMSYTAYACFSYTIMSGFTSVKGANFQAKIVVSSQMNPQIPPVEEQKNVYSYKLTPGQYTVHLSQEDNSSASTGFCTVTIGDAVYHTQQIGEDVAAENGVREAVQFVLDVKEESMVAISSCLGTSSYYESNDNLYIKNSDPLRTVVVGTASPSANTEDTNKDTDPTDPTTPQNTTPPETTESTKPVEETSAATETTEATQPSVPPTVQPSTEPDETTAPTSESTEPTVVSGG